MNTIVTRTNGRNFYLVSGRTTSVCTTMNQLIVPDLINIKVAEILGAPHFGVSFEPKGTE